MAKFEIFFYEKYFFGKKSKFDFFEKKVMKKIRNPKKEFAFGILVPKDLSKHTLIKKF